MSMEEEPDYAERWQEPGDWETKEEDKDNDAYFNKHHAHPTEESLSREAEAAHDEAAEKGPKWHATQHRVEKETERGERWEGGGDDDERREGRWDGEHHDCETDNGDDRGRYAWYNADAPPMALWVAGSDDLVDGRRLLRRFDRGREPHVDVVHSKVIPGYEHLDVIWAMDSIEQVGREVKEVIWATAPEGDRARIRVPEGCEGVEIWAGRKKRKERKRRAAEEEER